MKTFLISILFFIVPIYSFSQKETPKDIAEAMSNTFNFYGDKLEGTCFMLMKNEKQYFVTAAHLFKASHKSGDLVSIQIRVQNVLQPFNAKVYFNANRKVDIAVFTLPEKIIQHITKPDEKYKYPMDMEEYQKWFPGNGIPTDRLFTTSGLDVYFFGFPLGNMGTEFLGIRFPLVKKAIISGWVIHNGIQLLLLDGHNNLGFSGGPVVAYDTANKRLCLVGIVSGYLPEQINLKSKKASLSINANSGIMVCYGPNYIEEIFSTNKDILSK